MNVDSKEAAFQQDILDQMVDRGWQFGDPAIQVRSPTFKRNRRRA